MIEIYFIVSLLLQFDKIIDHKTCQTEQEVERYLTTKDKETNGLCLFEVYKITCNNKTCISQEIEKYRKLITP